MYRAGTAKANRTTTLIKGTMKRFKVVATVSCIAFISAILSPTAIADDSNRKTVVSFSGPVEIPRVHLAGCGVLPGGTYVFNILDSQSDRHFVQIFNKDETTVYATLVTVPNYRIKATDKTVITFSGRPAGGARSSAGVVLFTGAAVAVRAVAKRLR